MKDPAGRAWGPTLLALAGASVGLLEIFPGPYLPALGIAIALSMGGLGYLCRKRGQGELGRSSTGMQAAVLFLTTVVATLAQWHYDSPPLVTAAYLAVIAGLCAWQAHRDQELRWVHAAMVILALALPYLGFVMRAGALRRDPPAAHADDRFLELRVRRLGAPGGVPRPGGH